jgi:DDE family transposase
VVDEAVEAAIGERFRAMAPELNERQRRLWAATEARCAGWGGVTATARATGMAIDTIRKGIAELESGERLDPGRVRRPGAGRTSLLESDPTILEDIERLVDEDSRGDPESLLRWTAKSVRHIASALREMGHEVHFTSVATFMRLLGYSLQANVKTREGASHPDRDSQFQHINATAKAAVAAGWPVISVDTKKKELVGDFKNQGREWRPKGKPELVRVHDFKDKELGKAIPYGVYDLKLDTGYVNVGIDHDTAQFAVNSIRSWWEHLGNELPDRPTADDHRRLRRLQRQPATSVEGRAAEARQRNRTGDRGLPLPARHLEVEQNRAPPLLVHHDELARQAARLPGDDHQPHCRHHDHQRT